MFVALLLALGSFTACAPTMGGVEARERAAAVAQPDLGGLRTVAEESEYRATSTHAQTEAFLKELAAGSKLVHLADIGESGEKRKIPLALIADPPVKSAEEARRSGKLIVAMLGGIHAGECDGKEALLALARDIVRERADAGKKDDGEGADEHRSGEDKASALASLLDHAVLAFIPIYNPDGNEKMDPGNRPGQDGPETMGRRGNATGLDLNRDFVKLEAPETRGLLRFINQYDPHILIDTHTTNGSYHRYPLTWDTNKNPAGDAALTAFARGTMLPEIARAVKEKHNLDTFWYGNFEDGKARWEAYADEPRYGVNYFGMRNRVAVLTESYSYAPYKTRIEATYQFVSETLAYAGANRDKIRKLISDADRRSSGSAEAARGAGARGGPPGGRRGQRGGGDGGSPRAAQESAEGGGSPKPVEVPIRSRMVAAPEKVTVHGYVEEERDGRMRPTGEHKDYEVELWASFEVEKTVARPYAYIIPVSAVEAARTLRRHGIRVDEMREDLELDVTASTIDAVTRASRAFQGHMLVSVKATAEAESRWVPAGSYLVRTAQPLGNLATYLLEPESADSLATWNYFDEGLKIGEAFPVLRLEQSTPITTIAAAPLPEDREPKKPIAFAAVHESDRAPNLNGSPIGGFSWVDDEHFLQNKDGKLWKVHAATGRVETYIDTTPIAAALGKLPTITGRDADGLANRVFSSMDKGRTGFAFEHRNDLYYCKVDGSEAKRLTSTPEREEVWTFSPDGEFIAFVRDNDLWVVEVATATERRLTQGGTDTLRNGKADWVYFEEIFSRNWRTYWWAPDSSRIVYFQIDSSQVPIYTMVNDIPDKLGVENVRYPKVGEPNPTARAFIVTVAGGDPAEIDLSAYNAHDLILHGAGFFSDSSRAYVYAANRIQDKVDVLAAPADGGEPKVLFTEKTGAWVEPPPPLEFLKDGSFLFTSERSGWKHLYRYGRDGALIGPLTEGEWEARSVVAKDEENGWIYISGTRDSHIAENLYRVRLPAADSQNGSAAIQRLTTWEGATRCSVSTKGTYFIATTSTPTRPARVALHKTEDSSLVRTLDTNPVRDLDRFELAGFELVQIPMKDGFILEGSITRPVDFDPARKYPVWFQTYGGPQAPTINGGWRRSTFDETLCSAGFVVFRADPRPASGKGAVSAWTAYRKLGIQELIDIEEAVAWLCRNPWVDASRIGMSGHSYGGFMTSFALTHSKVFAAGIAGAPVTDWRLYDSFYTERYMGLPSDNREGYEKTSVVGAAGDLHGRLLLLHGMMDDNVHPQNATRLMRALQRADKRFDLMMYPESRHGLGGKHYQRLMYDFITRTLGDPPPPPPPPAAPAASEGSPEPAPRPERTGP